MACMDYMDPDDTTAKLQMSLNASWLSFYITYFKTH